jgi:prevent-host-death family protein
MKPLNVAEDIITVGEAKTQLSRVLRKVRSSGQPVVITQNGKPAGVLVTVADYEAMAASQRVRDVVARGMADLEAGRILTDEASERELDEVFGKRRR